MQNGLMPAEHAFTEIEYGTSPVSTLEYTPSADSPADSTELNDTQSTEPSRVLYWKHHQSHLSANRAAPGLDLSSLVTPTIALVRHGGHYMSLPCVLTTPSVEFLGGSGAQ